MIRQQEVFGSRPTDVFTATTSFTDIRKRLPQFSMIIVSGALAVSGTSSAEPARLWEAPYVHAIEATASEHGWQRRSMATNGAETTRKAVSELRRISGLTWEQLGELFGVSRRSVHFWASGKPLNAVNEQRLMQILDIVREADRGDARSTRTALFEASDGVTAFALLTTEQYKEARAILASGASRPRPALTQLSAEAKTARKPPPPEELIDAQHDRVHREHGQARAARTVRNIQRGTS